MCTKFQVSVSTRFRDTLGCTPEIKRSRDIGHAAFLDFSLLFLKILPLCVCVPILKSLSILVLAIRYGVPILMSLSVLVWRYVRVYAKIYGVTWHRPRPFSRFSFAGFEDIATMRLRTNFEVSIYTRFGDTLGRTPKFMGVTWPRPRPILDFTSRVFEILPLCLCVPNFSSLALLVFEIR